MLKKHRKSPKSQWIKPPSFKEQTNKKINSGLRTHFAIYHLIIGSQACQTSSPGLSYLLLEQFIPLQHPHVRVSIIWEGPMKTVHRLALIFSANWYNYRASEILLPAKSRSWDARFYSNRLNSNILSREKNEKRKADYTWNPKIYLMTSMMMTTMTAMTLGF